MKQKNNNCLKYGNLQIQKVLILIFTVAILISCLTFLCALFTKVYTVSKLIREITYMEEFVMNCKVPKKVW